MSISRREFLIAVGAIPVAVYFAQSPNLPAPISSLGMPEGLESWQQYLWAKLEAGTDVMYVTSTQKNAWRIYNVFQRHPRLFTTHIQGAIMGRRAELIVMDDFNDDMNPDWFNSCVRTRLCPEGKIEWIHT